MKWSVSPKQQNVVRRSESVDLLRVVVGDYHAHHQKESNLWMCDVMMGHIVELYEMSKFMMYS